MSHLDCSPLPGEVLTSAAFLNGRGCQITWVSVLVVTKPDLQSPNSWLIPFTYEEMIIASYHPRLVVRSKVGSTCYIGVDQYNLTVIGLPLWFHMSLTDVTEQHSDRAVHRT